MPPHLRILCCTQLLSDKDRQITCNCQGAKVRGFEKESSMTLRESLTMHPESGPRPFASSKNKATTMRPSHSTWQEYLSGRHDVITTGSGSCGHQAGSTDSHRGQKPQEHGHASAESHAALPHSTASILRDFWHEPYPEVVGRLEITSMVG